MDVFKKIGLMCLSVALLYPVSLLFGIIKPALLIAVTGLIIRFSSGEEVYAFPVRFAVAVSFTAIAISFISILYPISKIPVVILVLALLGIFILVDYRTKGKYEWYSRIILTFIMLTSIFRPDAWGVNELFYGFLLQALRLPDWVGRGMIMIDAFLTKHCRIDSLSK